MFRLMAIVAGAFILGVGGFLGWQQLTGPRTYDDCLLSEMRGQDRLMYATARSTCERRFGVEVPILISQGDWRWFNDGLWTVVRFSDEILMDYNPTRATFEFSTSSCETTDEDGFAMHGEGLAHNGEFRLGILAEASPVCLRMTRVLGTRR